MFIQPAALETALQTHRLSIQSQSVACAISPAPSATPEASPMLCPWPTRAGDAKDQADVTVNSGDKPNSKVSSLQLVDFKDFT